MMLSPELKNSPGVFRDPASTTGMGTCTETETDKNDMDDEMAPLLYEPSGISVFILIAIVFLP